MYESFFFLSKSNYINKRSTVQRAEAWSLPSAVAFETKNHSLKTALQEGNQSETVHLKNPAQGNQRIVVLETISKQKKQMHFQRQQETHEQARENGQK